MSRESKPISLSAFREAIKELPDDALSTTRDALANSLDKLKETNDYLLAELQPSLSLEDRTLYETSIQENKEVIEGQTQKLNVLNSEIYSRGLQRQQQTTVQSENEGVYL